MQKQIRQALSSGDNTLASSLQSQLDASGGLGAYQLASIQGQSRERGGDSSTVLVDWLHNALPSSHSGRSRSRLNLRLLEVGALRADNACSRSGLFDVVERIDLNSQHPSIKQQDFMLRPVPQNDAERIESGFDVVSLSLVVNYVADAGERGRMLRRVSEFLRDKIDTTSHSDDGKGGTSGKEAVLEGTQSFFPGLFLVLPAPCVLNSRYLDEVRLGAIMQSLGFKLVISKVSQKLVYHYFRYDSSQEKVTSASFGKKEVRKGSSRNNFAIVL